MTELCLVNVIDPESKIERHMPHLGLGYIAAYLREYSHFDKIKIVDGYDPEKILSLKPDIVGISSVSQNFDRTINLAGKIKHELDIPLIVGGIHISALPHTLPDCFDVAVIGEGEQTMLELLELYEDDGLERERLHHIKGIAFHDNTKIEITERRGVIDSLDRIPFPARDLLNVGSHTSMITSRGCPYKCVFCSSSMYWNKTRYFSAEYVVEEIKEMIEKYAVNMIDFWDDLFIANKKRLEQISRLLKEEGITDKVSFNCQARANLINDQTLINLKNMNVNQLSFGFESGSQNVLKYLKKDTVTVDQNRNAVFLSKKYGFVVNGSFVLGSPDETKDDIELSLRFLKNSYIDSGMVFMLTPYPGTELWDYAKQSGIVDDNMDWNKLNQNSEIIEDFKFATIDHTKKYIYLNKNISLEDISEYYIEFQKEFENHEMKLGMELQIKQFSKIQKLENRIVNNENQQITDEKEIIKLLEFMKHIKMSKLYKLIYKT